MNTTRIEACKFCMGSHRITTCAKKMSFGKEWTGTELIKYLKEEAPYSIMNAIDCRRIISSDISNTKTAKHLVVHMIHTRVNPPSMMNPSEEHLVATISLLNNKGDHVDCYHRCLVEFNYVMMYIGKHQVTKNRFLFCHVAIESGDEKFNAHINQHTQQSFFQSQQNLLSQLSQNSGNFIHMNQSVNDMGYPVGVYQGYPYPLTQQNNLPASHPEK